MTVEINGIPSVPAAVAAEELATTQLKILMLIKQKALCGEMIDGEWYVTRESLFSYDPEEEKPEIGKHECRSGCGGCH
jgi:hypothetical protein